MSAAMRFGENALEETTGSVGERSESERTGVSSNAGRVPRPDPEVPARATRRRHSPQYKAKILAEVEACEEPGGVGAILRREGLFASHLTRWRAAQILGKLDRSVPIPRGPKANPLTPELARLRRENARLGKKLRKAEQIIELQKKVSEVLGIALPALQTEDDDETS